MFTGNFTPASNKATWSESIQIIDAESDDPLDISDVDEITLEVRDPDTEVALLSATLTGGDITLLESSTGVFSILQWRFEASAMGALDPKTYDIGCIAEKDADTIQLVVASVPIVDGIVR